MKIAMLTNNYRPFVGGVPVSVERQAGALRALGHEVTVFAPDYGEEKGETEDPGDALGAQEEHVIRCGCFKRRMKNGMVYPKVAARQVREAFERESFDCVHVHQPVFMGNTALWLKRRYQVPVVYTWPGLPPLFSPVPAGGAGGPHKAASDPGGEGSDPAGLHAVVHGEMRPGAGAIRRDEKTDFGDGRENPCGGAPHRPWGGIF